MTHTTLPPQIVDSETVAQMFGVTRTCLWRWRRRAVNPLPALRIGAGVIRYDLDEVHRWALSHHEEPRKSVRRGRAARKAVTA